MEAAPAPEPQPQLGTALVLGAAGLKAAIVAGNAKSIDHADTVRPCTFLPKLPLSLNLA
jgi:hypothetical protein